MAHPLYYVIATSSGRTEHIKGGDIVLSINGQQLYTSPDITLKFKNEDEFFNDFVVPRIDAAKDTRICRVIRFFRKIYRGKYVAPRDAKLNHVEATYIFDKQNLEPMVRFYVGQSEPDPDDEPTIIRRARESGELPSFVFDVVFPDSESMGLSLWSNLLMWQSSLGAIDNTPDIPNVSRRVLPSTMAGTAPAPPPFMRAASATTTPSKPRVPTSTDMAHAYNMLQASPAAPVVREAVIDNSTLFANFVDPLLARRGKEASDKEVRDPARLPKPSETAGTAPSLPPFMRRPSTDASPPPTMKRLQPPPAPAPAAASPAAPSPTGPSPQVSPDKTDVVPSPQQPQQPAAAFDDFDDDGVSFGAAPPAPPAYGAAYGSEGSMVDDVRRAATKSASPAAAGKHAPPVARAAAPRRWLWLWFLVLPLLAAALALVAQHSHVSWSLADVGAPTTVAASAWGPLHELVCGKPTPPPPKSRLDILGIFSREAPPPPPAPKPWYQLC